MAPADTFRVTSYHQFLTRLGVCIRNRRKARELTQTELSARVQISQSSVTRLERGEQGFDSETLFQVAKALGCSMTDLIADAENTTSTSLSPEEIAFTKRWRQLPVKMREEYRSRIEALAEAIEKTRVPDEHEHHTTSRASVKLR